MTALHDMFADLRERNPKRLIDEDTFRQQFARRGIRSCFATSQDTLMAGIG